MRRRPDAVRPDTARPDTARASRRSLLLTAAATGLGLPAVAQTSGQTGAWPGGRPLRIVVPYGPGGFTDVTARLVAQQLQQRLGVPVNVDNRPGANSILGVDQVAKAAPDGSTFAMVIAAYAANTTLYPKLPYDPRRDLTGVSLVGLSPLVAAVNNDAPFKTAKELIAYARANPGKVSFGSSGNGSAAHLTTELLKAQTGTYMVHIPYRGAAAALADLMGGQIQLFLDAAQGLIQPGRTGRVRLIGVAADKRLAVLPDVPTFVEQGFKDFTGSTWAGLLAPAATPKEIVQRVADEVGRIVQTDEMRQRLEAMGTVPVGSGPADFNAFVDAETRKWAAVIQRAKVVPD